MPKKCYNCGMIKKTTFKCELCKKRVCLGCFDFVTSKCSNCDTEVYNEKYRKQIEAYIEREDFPIA